MDLEFDSTLEVYLVSGHANCYFDDRYYYRVSYIGWEIAAQFEGPWKSISTKKLPKGLRDSDHAKKNKNKNKNKKNK